ncbi:MAG TPA: chromosome segregation protein SMC [Thermodesulfovibrionales bacterium]|jgi:chromosome segregation protein|nr:chromosome segregation protein SMC [Thermodesulfovibrionales bacterium]
MSKSRKNYLVSGIFMMYSIWEMRVDKIELIGFKSFADRTTFHFHPGITCIVGPNGCGKSNIVDAFRWVLGEQSAKSLRGEKMEEVIFNGSTSKKPKGMAEVTMLLSGINSAQEYSSGESAEASSDSVSVTRRLYRSGDSEYMLNKSQCRLKDIKDLFLDTGLEVKSYSILEQDRIFEILNAKPLERRFLIEEVAGVMKFNVRKKEAISKLESSRANLQRINDIIVEVKKQISFLDRLAKKAEKYKKLTSEIHAIELQIAKNDYQTLKNSFQDIISEYNVLKEQESLKKSGLSKIENETEIKKLQLLEKEKILEQIQITFLNLEKEIAELEKTIAVARTERDNFKEYLVKLHQQAEEYTKKEEDFSIRKSDLETTGRDLVAAIERQGELLAEKAEHMRAFEDELIENEDLLEGKRREVFKISEELSSLRNILGRQQTSLEGLKHREESSIKDADNVKKVLSDLDSSLREMESNLLGKNNEILLLKDQQAIKVDEISANKNRIEHLRESLAKLKEELASFNTRIESLNEVIFDETTKEFLAGDLNFQLIASIADVFEIEHEYEKAIESVLSEKVNSFILSSYTDIENAIMRLKDKGLGRTAFIPVHPPSVDIQKDAPAGTVGKALNFIKTKEEFSAVAENVLADVFIVKDIKTALQLVSSGHRSFYVTPGGEVIEPSGVVIAGEIKGVFRRKREIREIESAREQTRHSIDHFQAALTSAQQDIESKEITLKHIETTIVDREKEISIMKLTAENYREEKERRSRKLAYLSLELEQISREKASIEKLLNEKDEEIRSVNSKKSDTEQSSTSLQEGISQKRSNLDEYRTEVTDIRLAITSFRERLEAVSKEKENILREVDENKKKKAFLWEEVSSTELRIHQREAEMAELEEKTKALVAEADRYRKDFSERKEVIDAENQELLTSDQGLKVLRNQIESLSKRIAELDIQRAEHKVKMETLHQHIRQNYGLAIDVVEVESLSAEDEKRLLDLREKIQELGPVNLGTIEEYEELRTRYEFLKNQQEDLDRSIAELEEAITRINVTTRKKLKEAFEALKTKFAEVFITLFAGGRAELVMTDENNILETGIDIIAQPPGKRLQNINLLSGGEKTLTALSLLFASFLIKPTPLCILDEADSALDEMNTEKFANMVKDFSQDTQFIVVTHNRNTMGVADYIYGITIEEAGVSKVISMQLVEA